ncbi:hypothetical protein [Tahibacter caeni]|uniref:hypothetical protein n=1 Tax=Tahibacter caeni TaxID=1453545 RepID=UPI0021491601|nr:hypothetical protein [Tahibacter caeni]
MKTLSLAMLGLAGMTFAGASMAVCPTDPAAPNGPWASKTVSAAVLNIVTPGLNSTECRVNVALNSGAALFAKSIVTDTTPENEGRYRARFYVDTTTPAGLTSVLRSVKLFNASATTAPAGLSSEEINITLSGSGGVPSVTFTIADSSQASNLRSVTVPLPNPNGVNRIEFDLGQGASAQFRYWVHAGNVASSDASPTGTITGVNNSGWSGITQASLGVFAASAQYRSSYGPTDVIGLDEFDSRRQTFIGQ